MEYIASVSPKFILAFAKSNNDGSVKASFKYFKVTASCKLVGSNKLIILTFAKFKFVVGALKSFKVKLTPIGTTFSPSKV